MMNRTDAAAILNIDPTASADEARRAYQELFTEHQMRLTNAPTPALRSLYQARLRELDEARDALLAPPPADATSDLPTDQPSIPDRQEQQPPAPKPVTPPRPSAPQSSPQKATSAPKEPPPPPPVRATPASNRGIRIVIGVVVLAIVIFVITRLAPWKAGTGLFRSDTTQTTAAYPGYADSVRAINDDISMARVELNRSDPDYGAAIKSLTDGDRIVAALPASSSSDTTVARLKLQLASQRASATKACEAIKRDAQKRGAPLPNCGP